MGQMKRTGISLLVIALLVCTGVFAFRFGQKRGASEPAAYVGTLLSEHLRGTTIALGHIATNGLHETEVVLKHHLAASIIRIDEALDYYPADSLPEFLLDLEFVSENPQLIRFGAGETTMSTSSVFEALQMSIDKATQLEANANTE